MQHTVRFDTRWKLSPQTVGIVGYSYSQSDYTGDELIRTGEMSDARNSQGHTMYVGGEHVFNPALSGTLLVGGQYYSFDRAGADSVFSPFVQGSINYALQTTTSLEAGVQYSRTAANVAEAEDAETAQIYVSLRREIISKLIGSVKGTVEHSEYSSVIPSVDGQTFLFYRLGLDLTYEFNQNLAAHVGYNYDEVDSDLPNRSYDRNRVYMGVTAGF
jgi:hypothetical protein